jgi:hypothetical protein
MIKLKIASVIFATLFLLSGCEDFLDRPQLDKKDDINYWENETSLEQYVNGYYDHYFVGYGTGNSVIYTPMTGFLTSDDIMVNGNQRGLEVTVPTSRPAAGIAIDATLRWIESYNGPDWSFYWVRKTNIMLDRIKDRMGDKLTQEQKNHWNGIGRFFRAMEYAELARVYGDVPYYDREIADTELNELYKNRTSRDSVMDHVYDDLEFAMNNVRLDDGDQKVNRYIVAAFASRLMLHEATWQKYYYKNNEKAKKYLEFAIKAADNVMSSGKYDIVTDFRSLFTNEDLKGNKDCILYRHYGAAVSVTHSIASYCNMLGGATDQNGNANLDVVKSFICADGKPWTSSTLENANKFDVPDLVTTRDPRFEATFYDHATTKAPASGLYTCKFIAREAIRVVTSGSGETLQPQYTGSANTNDYPVMRYAEVLLNWIEAKAELATLGGFAVTQGDIDASINKIRLRPLDQAAKDKGIKQTAPMYLADIDENFDANRDKDVSPLIWEIRRERRMEFFFERSRLIDLRRWHKLDYMNDQKNIDLLRGIWIDETQLSEADFKGKSDIAVVTEAGEKIPYDNGKNASKLIGYYSTTAVKPRSRPFWDLPSINVYLAPMGDAQRREYSTRGHELKQTEGWPKNLN